MTKRAVDLAAAERAVADLLAALGTPQDSDPELAETPRRVAAAWAYELLGGYDESPAALLSDATHSDAPGLVMVTGIAVVTMCPHHLLPATGVAHVGYWPSGKVVGLGALGKLVDAYARRFALQEDLGRNVMKAMEVHLGARAAGIVLDLSPTCMTARGERRHASRAVTMAFQGAANDDASLRAELLAAIRIGGSQERNV